MSVSLSEHLQLLAEAPDGIKKLRGLILELAVRGKLVPQDPKDEPASELLKRISAEKARLIVDGKIRKDKPLAAVGENEKPFELPVDWEWSRLQTCFDVRDGTHDTPKYQHTGFPLVTSKNIYGGRLCLENVKFISEADHKQISERSRVDRGDILFAMIGSIGNPVVVDIDPDFSIKNVALFKYYDLQLSSPEYLRTYLELISDEMKIQSAGGVQSFVSLGFIRSFPFPLPPLPEQHRIVAKVDELMALCDRMEAEQADAEAAHATLVQTLLGTLTQSRDAAELAANWQRLSQHFDTLFTTETSLNALKQTILQLAVMGKLVPQDPKDEPARELLKRIAAEKTQQVAEGKIKKDTPLATIGEDEKPFELPVGWEWVRLGSIATFENGDRSSRYPNEGDHQASGVPFFGAKDMVDGMLRFDNGLRFISETKFSELSNGKLFDGDFIILLRGTVGKMAIFHSTSEFSTGFINAQMLIVRILNNGLSDFFETYSATSFFQSLIANKTTGSAIKQMPGNVLPDFTVPLPPLAEQHRIVAKVDELMALCDSLKADLAESRARQSRLATTLIDSTLRAA